MDTSYVEDLIFTITDTVITSLRTESVGESIDSRIAELESSSDTVSSITGNILRCLFMVRLGDFEAFSEYASCHEIQHPSLPPIVLLLSYFVRIDLAIASDDTLAFVKLDKAAEQVAAGLQASPVLAITLWFHGVRHAISKHYTSSLRWFERSISVAKSCGYLKAAGMSMMGIGNINRLIDDYQAALQCQLEARVLYPDIEKNVHYLNNLGTAYGTVERYEESIEILKQVLDLGEKGGFFDTVQFATNNIANAYVQLKQFGLAEEYYKKSVYEYRQGSLEVERARAIGNLGLLYTYPDWEGRNIELGLEYLNQAIAVMETNRQNTHLSEFTFEAAAVYEEIGDWKNAAVMYKKTLTEEREVYSKELKSQAKIANAEYKTEVLRKEKEALDRQYEELQKANEFKTKLLSIAAHDLRSPLGAIISFAELSTEEIPPDSTTREYINHISHAAHNMLSLVSDLLDSTAAELGKMTLSTEECNLVELLMDSASRFSMQLRNKRQKLEFSLSDVYTLADYGKICQVIDNLLSNAIKYSPLDSTIYLVVERREDRAVLYVRDQGPGIAKEEYSLLFQQFQRLSSRPTGGETSTGLGLSIANTIAELHGGTITVESEKGKGSTFILSLAAL